MRRFIVVLTLALLVASSAVLAGCACGSGACGVCDCEIFDPCECNPNHAYCCEPPDPCDPCAKRREPAEE